MKFKQMHFTAACHKNSNATYDSQYILLLPDTLAGFEPESFDPEAFVMMTLRHNVISDATMR
jgi:hypothetical protein